MVFGTIVLLSREWGNDRVIDTRASGRARAPRRGGRWRCAVAGAPGAPQYCVEEHVNSLIADLSERCIETRFGVTLIRLTNKMLNGHSRSRERIFTYPSFFMTHLRAHLAPPRVRASRAPARRALPARPPFPARCRARRAAPAPRWRPRARRRQRPPRWPCGCGRRLAKMGQAKRESKFRRARATTAHGSMARLSNLWITGIHGRHSNNRRGGNAKGLRPLGAGPRPG